jgi:hypothetical protein
MDQSTPDDSKHAPRIPSYTDPSDHPMEDFVSPEKISLTRQELYERVWTTPMQKLAMQFGLSDVGLAKLCRRHEIPLPGRDYWAQVQFGQKPPRASPLH